MIFNQFEINFDTNEIVNMNDNNTKRKVEPRIMHVFQILISNSPEVVSREQLISEVWDNYGGADDALNQAISHLRKILNDTDKENRIIDTVVKKGYRFTQKIDGTPINQKNLNLKKKKSSFWFVIAAFAFCFIAIIIFSLSNNTSKEMNNTIAPEVPLNNEKAISNDSILAPDVNKSKN